MNKQWTQFAFTFGFIVAVCCTAILSGCAVAVWKLALSIPQQQCQQQESKSVVLEL